MLYRESALAYQVLVWRLGDGVQLACFARNFGPFDGISHQLFYDCVWTKIVDDDVVRLNYTYRDLETVDSDFFCKLDYGIETVLYD